MEAVSRVYFIYDDFYLKHQNGHSHPENPGRLTALVNALQDWEYKDNIKPVNPYTAEAALLEMVHESSYIKKIRKLSEKGGLHWLDMDTGINQYTFQSASLAAGGVFKGVELILGNDSGPVKFFAAVRPPGHHAFPGRGSGFCIFNNIALGAKYARSVFKIKKIAIIDFDAHHGNGTQDIFYGDDSVFYISFHQYPHYPGSGSYYETGSGRGTGYNLNFPFAARTGEPDYLAGLMDIVLPLMEKFRPQLIMVSAGYDSHLLDPLSSLELKESSYYRITSILASLSNEYCQGRMGIILEGGYDYRATADSILETLRGCLDFSVREKPHASTNLAGILKTCPEYEKKDLRNPEILEKIKEIVKNFER